MKLFLKMLLSVTLLAVVVGVSYLKTVPSDEPDSGLEIGSSSKFGANLAESDKTNQERKPKIEIDPIPEKNKAPNPPTDSATTSSAKASPPKDKPPKVLAITTETKKDDSKGHKNSRDTASASETASLAAEVVTDTTVNSDKDTREEQIILYFKQKLANLPTDLSSYEKKVAIKEVRDETCDLFHISRVKLTQLARVHKITYP